MVGPDPRRHDVPIAGVSALLGIPVPTIRSWERRYGFPSPPRTRGRHRRYSEHEIEQLRGVRDLITKGFAAAEAVRRVDLARGGRTGAELVERIVDAAMALDAARLDAGLDRGAAELGLERSIAEVALPAMREIGATWKAGMCGVDHEHLATQVVRAWLARQGPPAGPGPGRDPIVLACGPSDMHTIALEGFGVLLATRGRSATVLGALTPTEALVAAVRSLRSPAAVVTCQRSVTRKAAVASIEAVAAIPGVRAFYAGEGFASPSARSGVPGEFLGDDLLAAARTVVSATARA